MNFDKLREFIEIAKDSKVSDLSYHNGEEMFEVSFSTGVAQYHPPVAPSVTIAESNSVANEVKDPSLKEITSPFVGTFYSAASPGAAPYIRVGDKVSPGKVLCIVEAMKIMNEIEAEVSGEIVEICVENENYVEFGQVLFRVKL